MGCIEHTKDLAAFNTKFKKSGNSINDYIKLCSNHLVRM